MQLSDIVSRAIDLNTMMGVTSQKKAVAAAVALMRKDAEATEEARYVAASKLVHDQATRTMRKVAEDDPRQPSFFGDRLRARYALDVDNRVIKDLVRLARLEFRRIIAIREKQLKFDGAHLAALKEAYKELSPIWDLYPKKLYGEIEAIYLRRMRLAAE
jgi:hypothetical protein